MSYLVTGEPRLYHVGTQVQVGGKVRATGCHASVAVINRDGSVRRSPSPLPLILQFPEDVTGLVAPGSVWIVDGPEIITSYLHNGDSRYERTIKATKATFIRPTGLTLARWLRENAVGIGETLSNRLVRIKHLEKWVGQRNRQSLLNVDGMTDATVDALIESWPKKELFALIEFLAAHNMPVGVSQSIIRVLGEDALTVLSDRPFMLLGFGIPYELVAAYALKIGFSYKDPEFVAGVCAHVAFTHSEETGSTVIDERTLHRQAELLTGHSMPQSMGDIAVEHKLMVRCGTLGYQPYGCALMEHEVAKFIVNLLLRPPGTGVGQIGTWATQFDRNLINLALQKYEENHQNLPLSSEQREAVIGSIVAPVCGISGGAGTGKTTTLRAILSCYELLAPDLPTYQVAIAGRAAQRIAESTERPASTIAKFIAEHSGKEKQKLPEQMLLIIDEASMLDLLSMYRIIRLLPCAVRIIFVGDSMQLLPVGKGLVFHALLNAGIPFFELKQPMRQNMRSAIHGFATNLRNGIGTLPPAASEQLDDCAECALIESSDPDLLTEYWLQAGGVAAAIVLCPVKAGSLGVDNINHTLQKAVGLSRAPLLHLDSNGRRVPWVASDGMRLLKGDPVLVIQNNYGKDADIRNGDLGVLEYVADDTSISGNFGTLKMADGRIVEIGQELLDKLSLGYAITIHKSQGSQWGTCFVTLPTNASQMIDQSLLYTAVTRAKSRVLLFGDRRLIKTAVKRGAASLERVTTLNARIRQLLHVRQQLT